MIYLASPYSDPDPAVKQARYDAAVRAVGALMARGETVYSPIVSTHPVALACDLPGNWEYWERVDREFVRLCDRLVVLTLPGWRRSKGVAAEVAYARELGMPVDFLSVKHTVLKNSQQA